MVVLDHGTLGYITFGLMSFSMLSGAFIFLSKKRQFWIKVHLLVSILAYIFMVWTIWVVGWKGEKKVKPSLLCKRWNRVSCLELGSEESPCLVGYPNEAQHYRDFLKDANHSCQSGTALQSE